MTAARRRLRECVERWPECESGAYDPRCCRFPKSCSCTSWPSNWSEVDLEPLPESSAAITPWPSAESSAARPCGTCWRCGGTLYEYLTHQCSTSVRMVQNVQGGIRLTPWGTWEWRPW